MFSQNEFIKYVIPDLSGNLFYHLKGTLINTSPFISPPKLGGDYGVVNYYGYPLKSGMTIIK